MDKREYRLTKSNIEATIAAEKSRLVALEKEYLESNLEFEVGQRVKLVTPPYEKRKVYSTGVVLTAHRECFAYIYDHEINRECEVVVLLKREKADGSISNQRIEWNSLLSYLEHA